MSAVSRREDSLSLADMESLNDFSDSELFTEVEKAVLQYATEMTSTPVKINDENFSLLKGEFSEKQLVELTATIAHENFRARYNHAFGIESANFHTEEVST